MRARTHARTMDLHAVRSTEGSEGRRAASRRRHGRTAGVRRRHTDPATTTIVVGKPEARSDLGERVADTRRARLSARHGGLHVAHGPGHETWPHREWNRGAAVDRPAKAGAAEARVRDRAPRARARQRSAVRPSLTPFRALRT